MNFVADESVDAPIVERLRSEGYSVLSIAESSPSVSDDEVLSVANLNQAVLMTGDKDFGELIFRLGRATHGVLLLRLAGLSTISKCDQTSLAVRDHESEMPNNFTVVSPGVIRIRRSN